MSGRGRASRAKRRGSRVWGKVFPGSKTRPCEEQEAECKRPTEVQRVSPGTKRVEKALRIQEEFRGVPGRRN